MTKLLESKPFIIAEVGSNFNTFLDAINSILAAKACGADAVKFQLFSEQSLYGFSSEETRLKVEWLPQLKEKADACGIEFMCTAFSEKFVNDVDPFVSVHKIASSDSLHLNLIKHVASKGKPYIVSCGGSSLGDTSLLLSTLKERGIALPTVLMYCNASYPSYAHNLFNIDKLKAFEIPVGFSDHSLDVVYAPLSAFKHFGAVVIEKHFKIDLIRDTPDSEHSLSQFQFKMMTDYIRGIREDNYVSYEEKEFVSTANRRAIALKDISAGEPLFYGKNFGYYRSLHASPNGMCPIVGSDLDGCPILVSKKKFDAIDYSEIQKII